jgi:hypothetical protein
MDAYVGAGILLDLFSSSALSSKQTQPKPQAKPQPKPQQKAKHQQQQQQLMQNKQMQAPTTQHHQQQQQVPLLPLVQTRPKIALILDLSGSPRHPDSTPAAAAAAAEGISSPVFGGPASPSSRSRPHHQQQQRQRQVLHLGLPSAQQSFSMSPASSTHNHSLPPRPPRMPHHHAQSVAAQHTYAQQQQQQQVADLKPEHIQAALDVASKLGAALGSDSQAFARIISFVSSNSNKPAALYQFMAATLAQIEGGNGAPAAPTAAAAAAAAAALSPGKQQPRGLML